MPDTCVFCRLPLIDDGDVLIDSTGGDACGMPIVGIHGNHLHCRGFAPDSWGEDPDICIECLLNRVDHEEEGGEALPSGGGGRTSPAPTLLEKKENR